MDEEEDRERMKQDEDTHEEEHRRWMEDHRRRMRIMLELIKYVRPGIAIPKEFFEPEDVEESNVAALLKISEVLVTSPPIEEVVCFSASVPVPQKTVAIPITL